MCNQAWEAGFSATLDFYHFLVGSHIKQTVKHHLGGRDRRGYKKRRKEKEDCLYKKEFIILMEAGKITCLLSISLNCELIRSKDLVKTILVPKLVWLNG